MSQVSISHVGDSLGDKIVNDVLFIPEFKYNLLSVSQLTKQLRCVVLFFPNLGIFQDLFNGNVLGICKENQGLYMLQTTLNLQQKVPVASNSPDIPSSINFTPSISTTYHSCSITSL